MSERQTVHLTTERARTTAHRYVDDAPAGYMVTVSLPTKRRVQEGKYHAMIGDIARQTAYAGRTWSALHMKRILIDEFAEEMRAMGTPLVHGSETTPSEDGRRIIQLEIRSSDFSAKEAAAFIEFLYAWGADRGVPWSAPEVER